MVTVHDIQEQIEQLDLQMLSLLQDRVKLYAEARRDDDEPLDDADVLAMWIEEAGERGLDEGLVEKLCKIIVILSRRTQD